MSCELYSGTPGSGKSLHAAKRIVGSLKGGHTVIANFPIDMKYFERKGKMPKNLGKFLYVQNQDLTVKFLKQYSKNHFKHFKEGQGLVVIDECAVLFNPRADRRDRMEWITFLTQHRKYGYDILLISQSDCLIDRQIRPMIETEYKHRAMSNYGVAGWLMSFVFGKWFWVNQYWYGCRMKLASDCFKLNKKQAAIYDSFKLFDDDDAEEEKEKVPKHGKQRKKIYLLPEKAESVQ